MSLEQALEIVLQKVKSGNNAHINEANAQTKQWEDENLAAYIFGLCSILLNPQKDSHDRSLAGVLLRGTLEGKDPSIIELKRQRWLQALPEEVKAKIKEAVLSLLADPEVRARQAAAQIVSSIALVELPVGRWPELLPMLLSYVTNPASPTTLKEGTLEAIGNICESIKPEILEAHADKILTAIVHCMRPDQTDIKVKKAACQALSNSLEFCKQNFESAPEREVLMNVILEAMLTNHEETKVIAYSILVDVASMHYDKLMPYMQKIFKLTLEAITNPQIPENVCKQAIEFWCTICEEEIAVIDEIEFAKEQNLPQKTCHFYTKGALQYLVPAVTEALTRQDDNVSPDDCTVAMAAGICLTLVAQTVEDEVVPHVIPFIERHITSQDWRFKEAAILAFGSILEGPHKIISPFITQATPVLLQHMKDPKTAVKDTTAWTLGRILKHHPKAVLAYGEEILKLMVEALADKPRVATNAAWAIHNLASSFQHEDNNPVYKYFNDVVQLLLVTGDRPDADEENLRTSTYEALNFVLATSPPQAVPALERLIVLILERLEQTSLIEIVHQDDQNKQNEIQGLLCGVIQVVTNKIDTKVKIHADRIMTLVIKLFKSKRDSSVYEEAFMTVAAIANVVEGDFVRYMPEFYEYLCNALANWQEYQVCSIAVGVVGDLARALGVGLVPYCDRIITLLLQNLQNRALDRSVKPPILSCFGDIALAIGGNFVKYMEVVMNMLNQAADTVIKTTLNADDWDLVEYINSLREGIFEAYTGIIQALRVAQRGDFIQPHVNAMIKLVHHVASDPRRTESVSLCAVGICGDIALTLGSRVKQALQQQFISQLIQATLHNAESAETKETAEWARTQILEL